MKKLFKINIVALLLTGVFTLTLISCDRDDDPKTQPVKIEDLNGNYTGKVATTQGSKKNEVSTTFSANKGIITFTEFPIKEIVNSVISDPAKATAAVAALGKVKYELNYTAVLNKAKTGIDLTFAPKMLELQIPVDGGIKKAVISFVTLQKGIYIGKTKSLQFNFTGQKITVDGIVLNPYQDIIYDFSKVNKK